MTQSRGWTPIAEDGFVVDNLHSPVAAESLASPPSTAVVQKQQLQQPQQQHQKRTVRSRKRCATDAAVNQRNTIANYYPVVPACDHTQATGLAIEQLSARYNIAADATASQPVSQSLPPEPSNPQSSKCVQFPGFRESGAKPILTFNGRKTVDAHKPQEPSITAPCAGAKRKRTKTKQKNNNAKPGQTQRSLKNSCVNTSPVSAFHALEGPSGLKRFRAFFSGGVTPEEPHALPYLSSRFSEPVHILVELTTGALLQVSFSTAPPLPACFLT